MVSQHSLVLGQPDLDDARVVNAVASAQPDVILSWFWPKRIPGHLLALAPRGAFGVHPSLLPRWRGPDPYFWALKSGDLETGVTLHRLDEHYDTGRVVAQTRLAIDAAHTSWSLAKALDRPSLELLLRAATQLARGEALMGEPQNEAQATEAPQPDAQAVAISWRSTCADITRLVRAARPYPGATMQVADEILEVLKVDRFFGSLPRALEPGDAVLATDGVVMVAADGGVVLHEVRLEDGDVCRGVEIADLFPELARLPASP
jgi:methionyl-tRNA formyltransferase